MGGGWWVREGGGSDEMRWDCWSWGGGSRCFEGGGWLDFRGLWVGGCSGEVDFEALKWDHDCGGDCDSWKHGMDDGLMD